MADDEWLFVVGNLNYCRLMRHVIVADCVIGALRQIRSLFIIRAILTVFKEALKLFTFCYVSK